MATSQSLLIDGTTSFGGGQDASRSTYQIDVSQYQLSINMSITAVGDNLTQRPGYVFQKVYYNSLKDKQIFESGHIQGADWFFDGAKDNIIVAVDGFIFRFLQQAGNYWFGQVINYNSLNNPTRTKVWTCRIPGNQLIVSDGQSLPFVIGYKSIRRTDPNKKEIGVTRMMAYVQSRLFYVGEFGTEIFASDFLSPLTIKEAINTRIFGWHSPTDEQITAIGTQRFANIDENGGELVFSHTNSIYAVDVRGDRQDWGVPGGGIQGFCRLVIPNFGATSAYSFTNFNANLYFRTLNKGIFGYRQALSQFNNDDETVSGSVEVNNWLDADTTWLLDQCWSVNYKGRLLTTTQPCLTQAGYVYWTGLVSMNPSPLYSGSQKLPRRFEGLWTGIQPWCLIHQKSLDEKLFIVSRDADEINRLYMVDETSLHDVDAYGNARPIESVLQTRSYSFGSPETSKIAEHRYYTLDAVLSDLDVRVSSRVTQKGQWTLFDERKHYYSSCTKEECLPFNAAVPEARLNTFLAAEKDNNCTSPYDQSGGRFNYRAYRIEFKGAFELSTFVAFAKPEPLKNMVLNYETKAIQQKISCEPKQFQYKVTMGLPPVTQPLLLPSNAGPSTTSSSGCGCNT